MQLSARGALNVDTDARLFLGKSMGTGRRVGILIRQRYALMSSICLTMQRANARSVCVNNWFEILGPSEFPPAWEAMLQQRVPIYRLLSEPDRQELRSYIRWFVGSKEFEGCAGLVITDEIGPLSARAWTLAGVQVIMKLKPVM